LATFPKSLDDEGGMIVPPGDMGKQVLACPVVHHGLEQLFVGKGIDGASQLPVCVYDGVDEVTLIHKSRIPLTVGSTMSKCCRRTMR
jgi:hypothetical protein